MSFVWRRWCLAATAFCLSFVPALAGDSALINFIGFSNDERYLAFEEYDETDGIGVAYSGISIIDLTTGDFAAGSPFYKEADEKKQEPLAEIRAVSAAAARAALAELEITRPVEVLALSGDGVIGPATEIRFGLPAWSIEPGGTQGDYTLSLQTFDLPKTAACDAKIERAPQGFALSLAGDGATRELHRDTALAQWRGCPVGYRLYAMVTPYEGSGLSAGAAIVSAYPFDFEGPSRRFVVVPIGEAK
jgi:predicted secreted protein